ncbi:MAG TPA: hypothetical protein VJV05_04745 [Pyrinomonadaceae bacterium]|nr:hypothetical protein [Pyrinomonadaceae bacterium]
MPFDIRGVHPIDCTESCYLIEVELSDPTSFDWDSVTQEIIGTSQANWQAAWNEQPIAENRWGFFFHDLNLEEPLITSFGPVRLPAPTPLPARLGSNKYESPR